MSWAYFEDDCPGCRPALIDMKTRERVPEDSPEMQAVLGVWAKTTAEERRAFHRFTCQNSRTPEDLKVMRDLSEKMSRAMSGPEE
jgi:hypothetical protein